MTVDKTSPLEALTELMRPAIQSQLRSIIPAVPESETGTLPYMLSYQLGWVGEGAGPQAQGKQIRPLMVLFAADAGGGNWQHALPAAGAVELLHNFSLIHDDIQDGSPTRRGRPTIWKRWGEAQAINTGDAMFALAIQSILDLENTLPPHITLQASRIFQQACLHLTQGQYLDLDFENRDEISLDEYGQMVSGKTAALLEAAMELGALCADVSPPRRGAFRDFGRQLGFAFQAQDDILGIWGEKERVGKSIKSDLVTRKKTLPILYGLTQRKRFYQHWKSGNIISEDVPVMAQLLEEEGARKFAQREADRLTKNALDALREANPEGKGGDALHALAEVLLKRKG